MASFFEALEARCAAVDSLLCVGLDPHTTELGDAPSADAAAEFCLRLIEATSPVAAAYKPNAAFFEVFGAAGATALGRVIAAIPAGIPVLLDAKRGDIGSTAAAYASAAFDELKVRARARPHTEASLEAKPAPAVAAARSRLLPPLFHAVCALIGMPLTLLRLLARSPARRPQASPSTRTWAVTRWSHS